MATDVRNAGCYDPNEEAKLRRVIGEVGEERFNESIIKLSKSIIKDLEKKASWYAVWVGIRTRVRAKVMVKSGSGLPLNHRSNGLGSGLPLNYK